MQWGTTKETYAKGVNRWSEDFVFPRSLWAVLAKEDVQHIAINNVLLPVKETEKNRQALADACAQTEHRLAARKLTLESIVKRTHCVLTFRCYKNLDAPRELNWRRPSVVAPPPRLPVFGPHRPERGPPPGGPMPAYPQGLRGIVRASVDSPCQVGQPSKRIPSHEKDDRGQISSPARASGPSRFQEGMSLMWMRAQAMTRVSLIRRTCKPKPPAITRRRQRPRARPPTPHVRQAPCPTHPICPTLKRQRRAWPGAWSVAP